MKYRRWIAAQGCILCKGPAQCCHLANNGMSQKGPDYDTVPLCPQHHDQFDGRAKLPNGSVGKEAFLGFYRIVDLSIWAEALHEIWLRENV